MKIHKSDGEQNVDNAERFLYNYNILQTVRNCNRFVTFSEKTEKPQRKQYTTRFTANGINNIFSSLNMGFIMPFSTNCLRYFDLPFRQTRIMPCCTAQIILQQRISALAETVCANNRFDHLCLCRLIKPSPEQGRNRRKTL